MTFNEKVDVYRIKQTVTLGDWLSDVKTLKLSTNYPNNP